jgi:hypothetical protein
MQQHLQWVETNQSNFRIFPADICFLLPHGTMLMAFADVKYGCCRMLEGVGLHPPQHLPWQPNCFYVLKREEILNSVELIFRIQSYEIVASHMCRIKFRGLPPSLAFF